MQENIEIFGNKTCVFEKSEDQYIVNDTDNKPLSLPFGPFDPPSGKVVNYGSIGKIYVNQLGILDC